MIEKHLPYIVEAYITRRPFREPGTEPLPLPQLYIVAPDEDIAQLDKWLRRCLPPQLLRHLSFGMFENENIAQAKTEIVGIRLSFRGKVEKDSQTQLLKNSDFGIFENENIAQAKTEIIRIRLPFRGKAEKDSHIEEFLPTEYYREKLTINCYTGNYSSLENNPLVENKPFANDFAKNAMEYCTNQNPEESGKEFFKNFLNSSKQVPDLDVDKFLAIYSEHVVKFLLTTNMDYSYTAEILSNSFYQETLLRLAINESNWWENYNKGLRNLLEIPQLAQILHKIVLLTSCKFINIVSEEGSAQANGQEFTQVRETILSPETSLKVLNGLMHSIVPDSTDPFWLSLLDRLGKVKSVSTILSTYWDIYTDLMQKWATLPLADTSKLIQPLLIISWSQFGDFLKLPLPLDWSAQATKELVWPTPSSLTKEETRLLEQDYHSLVEKHLQALANHIQYWSIALTFCYQIAVGEYPGWRELFELLLTSRMGKREQSALALLRMASEQFVDEQVGCLEYLGPLHLPSNNQVASQILESFGELAQRGESQEGVHLEKMEVLFAWLDAERLSAWFDSAERNLAVVLQQVHLSTSECEAFLQKAGKKYIRLYPQSSLLLEVFETYAVSGSEQRLDFLSFWLEQHLDQETLERVLRAAHLAANETQEMDRERWLSFLRILSRVENLSAVLDNNWDMQACLMKRGVALLSLEEDGELIRFLFSISWSKLGKFLRLLLPLDWIIRVTRALVRQDSSRLTREAMRPLEREDYASLAEYLKALAAHSQDWGLALAVFSRLAAKGHARRRELFELLLTSRMGKREQSALALLRMASEQFVDEQVGCLKYLGPLHLPSNNQVASQILEGFGELAQRDESQEGVHLEKMGVLFAWLDAERLSAWFDSAEKNLAVVLQQAHLNTSECEAFLQKAGKKYIRLYPQSSLLLEVFETYAVSGSEQRLDFLSFWLEQHLDQETLERVLRAAHLAANETQRMDGAVWRRFLQVLPRIENLSVVLDNNWDIQACLMKRGAAVFSSEEDDELIRFLFSISWSKLGKFLRLLLPLDWIIRVTRALVRQDSSRLTREAMRPLEREDYASLAEYLKALAAHPQDWGLALAVFSRLAAKGHARRRELFELLLTSGMGKREQSALALLRMALEQFVDERVDCLKYLGSLHLLSNNQVASQILTSFGKLAQQGESQEGVHPEKMEILFAWLQQNWDQETLERVLTKAHCTTAEQQIISGWSLKYYRSCKVDQLWYMWSDIGLDTLRAGFRIRAASEELKDIRSFNVQSLDRYLRYLLPRGAGPATLPNEAPVCLSLITVGNKKVLLHKVYTGKDAIGRYGAFFIHLLYDLPGEFSAKHAISLWKSRIWKESDESLEDRRSTELKHEYVLYLDSPKVRRDMIPDRNDPKDMARIKKALSYIIEAYLTKKPVIEQKARQKNQQETRQKIYIAASDSDIARLISGLTHCLPPQLIKDLTFSTYEHNINEATTEIVGICWLSSNSAEDDLHVKDLLPAQYYQKALAINCYTGTCSSLQDNPLVENKPSATEFANKAAEYFVSGNLEGLKELHENWDASAQQNAENSRKSQSQIIAPLPNTTPDKNTRQSRSGWFTRKNR